ncbi:MAG: 4Fe-4S dicluster domain-containing protein [Elusimicrobia bacterium]|nr:4Fe-4S dicluster domain-containing protein [Elusimicrobiota bacterium]
MPDPLTRRRFLLHAAGAGAAFAGALAALHAAWNGPLAYVGPDARRRGLIRPPGARAEEELLSRCIRCQRCAEVCETGAIRLLPSGSRLAGTPHLTPETSACDLCLRCGPACPTGALEPLASMAQARMGLAVVDKRLCVSHNGTGVCGACFTICPLKGKAIRQGTRNAPEVTGECVGCGLCEEACIVTDPKAGRAIRVRSERAWA